ncbi:hypothetical protein NL676_014468 [Syzygium grande]|nr:hypothetical protein NL676_014468 [Syzygium grande]
MSIPWPIIALHGPFTALPLLHRREFDRVPIHKYISGRVLVLVPGHRPEVGWCTREFVSCALIRSREHTKWSSKARPLGQ